MEHLLSKFKKYRGHEKRETFSLSGITVGHFKVSLLRVSTFYRFGLRDSLLFQPEYHQVTYISMALYYIPVNTISYLLQQFQQVEEKQAVCLWRDSGLTKSQ